MLHIPNQSLPPYPLDNKCIFMYVVDCIFPCLALINVFASSSDCWVAHGGGNPGVMGTGSLPMVGEEGAGGGIAKGVGAGRNRGEKMFATLHNIL